MMGYKRRWGGVRVSRPGASLMLFAGKRLEGALYQPADGFIKDDDMHVNGLKWGTLKADCTEFHQI